MSAALTLNPCSKAYRDSAEVLNTGEVPRTQVSRLTAHGLVACSICLLWKTHWERQCGSDDCLLLARSV